MRITIIGAGNMGGAAAIGIAKAGQIPSGNITVTARHTETFERFKPFGIQCSLDNAAAAKDADIVMLVVKPWLVKEVVEQIKPSLDYSRQTLVCMAAGIPSDELLGWLSKDGEVPPLVYVIPNTAIEILQSMTFIAPINSPQDKTALVESIFEGTGMNMTVTQKQLSSGTALASCGIAYAMRYIRAASEGGVELGFYAKDAAKIVCQTVMGAASLILENNSNPEVEIDKVTTPGGITIKGLNAMEAAGFTNAVISGLKASHK